MNHIVTSPHSVPAQPGLGHGPCLCTDSVFHSCPSLGGHLALSTHSTCVLPASSPPCTPSPPCHFLPATPSCPHLWPHHCHCHVPLLLLQEPSKSPPSLQHPLPVFLPGLACGVSTEEEGIIDVSIPGSWERFGLSEQHFSVQRFNTFCFAHRAALGDWPTPACRKPGLLPGAGLLPGPLWRKFGNAVIEQHLPQGDRGGGVQQQFEAK